MAGFTTLRAATFPVTNTNDAGPGSLRQAIVDLNAAGAGPHEIVFNVYGQINLLASLPAIMQSDVTIDGQNRITLNSVGTNQIINPFDIRADRITVRNFVLTNNGDIDIIVRAGTTGVLVENISTYSTTGNFLNSVMYVEGPSTDLTVRNITSTDVELCGGGYPHFYGRAFIFVGGMHTNLVMDSIELRTQNNTRGCEGIVFRDASVNGWTFTNSKIYGFQNGIMLDHINGPVETANNILLDNIVIDSTHSGVALGFYSDFTCTNITLKNCHFDLDVRNSTDDGDYNIRFDGAVNGVTMDSVTAQGTDIHTLWFRGAATNVDIRHSRFDGAQAEGPTQVARFEAAANTVLMRSVVIEGDRPGTTDDCDYGLIFMGALTDVELDSLTVNEFDVDGLHVVAANTNFQITNSRFTNNFDGIEFYNNVPRSNVDIVRSVISGSARSGIVINGANATTDVDITEDTIYNSAVHGIWLHGGTPATDIMISGNVIYDNGGAGIFNNDPDKVIYTGNSIYNNTSLGIDNVAGNCGYQNPGSVPVLVSSIPLGAGEYELVISLPALVPAGYTVDLYANDPSTSASSGQYYVTTFTNLNSGNNTVQVTYNTGPGATGAGFWTATLRIPANNCGTSEFSNKLAISTQGPGNVDANVKLWLRADAGLTNNSSHPDTEGQVVNRWSNFSQGGAPAGATSFGTVTYKKAGINFNPAGYFSNAVIQATGDGSTWLNSAEITSFAVFKKYTNAPDGSRVFVVYDNASGGYDYNTNAESIIFARTGTNIQTHRGNQWENPAVPNALGKAGLFTSVTTSTAHGMYYNGGSLGASAYNKGNFNAEQWFVGGGYTAGWCCGATADIAEVITFDRQLTVAELDRVHSYLAIKYGITLPGNYVASDGTTLLWDAGINTGYTQHITGIGRDDSTFLYQKQSVSADTGIVTLALGDSIVADNPSNAATIAADKSFFVFGDNGAATSYATAVNGAFANQRMARVWKVQKTNWTDQNITLRVNGAGSRNYLLISTDPSFASISQELPLDGAGSITVSTSMLADGVYFTIGANIKGAACVSTGIGLWLRADDAGTSGALWGDFSGNGNGATQTDPAKQASLLSAAVNFNPALKFDGVNDMLSSPSLFTATGTNNIQIYAVAVTDQIKNQNLFGELVSNGQYVHAHVPWSNGILYWDAPYGYRAEGAWGGQVGAPYLWSFLRSPSAMHAYRNNIQVSVRNEAMTNIAGANNPFAIGAIATNVQYFNGKIAELIVYNNSAAITATQRQQIESYLALKYGLTLSPASPVDYLASDGTTTMWNATANAGYQWHITGIGRDSCTGLHQKQSLSVDTGYVTIALGNSIAVNNASNPAGITNDLSFLVIGDNGAAKTFSRPITGLPEVQVALGRTWKVDKTNWADQDITFVTDSAFAAPQYLIISADETFGAGDLLLPVTDRKVTFNSGQLPDGAFFTFANALRGPGNVSAGIAAWWRADADATSYSWSDYSGNGKILIPQTAGNEPTLLPVNVNYQPAMKFGNNQAMISSSVFGTASTDNIAIFAVSAADGLGANGAASGLFSEYVSNGDRIAAWAPYPNGHIYWYPPLGWSVGSATPLISYANPRFNVLGFTKTPAQLNIYFNSTNVGTQNGAYTGVNGNNQPFYLAAYNGPDWYNGRIAEFVVYNNASAMTATDRQKIQSYLALKYGITLSPAAPVDYLASDGSTLWSATDNGGYHFRITGIGRDDSSGLYQKQSLSIDTGLVAIAAGTALMRSNALNTTDIPTDKSFLVFGDDGAASGYLTPVSGIAGVNTRMTRIFKVDKTNWTDQDITLKLSGANAETYLLVSADASFGAGDAAWQFADSTVTLNSSDLPDGAYFTFGATLRGPNAVHDGIMVWLRADDGSVNGGQWNDFSGFGAGASQPLTANRPVTDAKGINFNYAMKFDGVNDFMENAVDPLLTSNNATLIAVVDQQAFTVWGGVMSYNRPGNAERPVITNTDINNRIGVNRVNVNAVQASFNTPAPAFLIRNLFTPADITATGNGGAYAGTVTPSWTGTGTAPGYFVGKHNLDAHMFNGYIAEVIAYNRPLDAAELQRVESYLALKYGVTLNNGATAYLASDDTEYWTVDATFNHRITGIGRDDSTLLNTRQSLSQDTGTITLALGSNVELTNELNSGVITNDRSFFVFADNGLDANNFTVQLTGSANGVNRRMARVWKVQKTNWTDQDITLKLKPIGIDNYLLISNDPDFATISHELPVSTEGVITLSSALFSGGDIYFTFGAPLKSPGGVAGHALWVRADIGASTTNNTAIGEWSDMSALANSATQSTAGSQPVYLNNQADNTNFNPVVNFAGSRFMHLDVAKLPVGTSARTVIITGKLPAVGGANHAISWGGAVANGASGLRNAASNGEMDGYGNFLTSTPGLWQVNQFNELSFTWLGGTNTNAGLYSKQRTVAGPTLKSYNTASTAARLGMEAWSAAPTQPWNGAMGDVIVYPYALNEGQRLKVNSYLAIKYGYTIDQATPNNYLATDSTVIWDATANAAYNNNIAGIGRDDEEALRQKQSRSINTGLQVAIGLGIIDSTNTANPNDFTTDRSYLVWGDDNASALFSTAIAGNPAVNFRMGRIWKVQETGTVGSVQIAIPASVIPDPSAAYLVVSDDDNFDGADQFIQLTAITVQNATWWAAQADLENGQYFTFADFVKSPGGVVGTSQWFRADFGTSTTTDNTANADWKDFTFNVNSVSQPAAASQPTFRNNAVDNINFNPVLSFDGNDYFNLNVNLNPASVNPHTNFIVYKPYVAGRGLYGNDNNAFDLGHFTSLVLGWENTIGYAGGNTLRVPVINEALYQHSGAADSRVYVNNLQRLAFTYNGANGGDASTYLGTNGINCAGCNNFFVGPIGEYIRYHAALTANERQRVNTYLSIKYGVTMDQTVATDYLATDNTVVWDATANAAYQSGITGIGRDDVEGLNQKQSRNTDTTRMNIAIGLGSLHETNLDNANTLGADKTYLVWGDNNGSASFKTPLAGKPEVNYRMARIWKVQETGTVGEVEVAIPYEALPNPRESFLVISADETIDNTDAFIPLYDITLNGKKYWAAKTDFASGTYFTVAAFIKSPGGVGATSLWVRADQGILNDADGAAVDTWIDFGNEVNNASQATIANQPAFARNATDNINYNPVMKFNGSSDFMNLDVAKLPAGTTARTVIGVGKPQNVTGNKYIVSWGAAAGSQGMGLASAGTASGYFVGYGNDLNTANNFWQLNVLNELFGTWNGTGGEANLYSKMLQVAAPQNKAWNTGTTGARIGNSVWGSEFWNGLISEVIAFDRALNAGERQRVSTYLAIRNGYTIDQTVPVDYLNTNGAVIWNATANSDYRFNIAGIGRDDVEGLNQKQAKSANAGAVLAIGLGALAEDNLSNSNNFSNDTAYLIWGSSSSALTVQSTDVPGVFGQRLTQEWKVSLSNFDNGFSPVAMEFDLNGIAHSGTDVSHFTLIVDTDGDGDFTTGTITEVPATSYAGDIATFNNVTALTDGSVFTVAIGQKSLQLITRVILQGAWNGTAMRTDLKAASVLPATDPYGNATTPAVTPNATSAQVVDWVLVELRDASNPTTILESRAAILLSNGNVVDTGYAQPLRFYNATSGNYLVSIRHRNHLGVMTLNPVDFSTGIGTVDFTSNATQTYGTYAQTDLGGGVMALWAGNVDGDNAIRHSAKVSDATAIAYAVLTHNGNAAADPAYTGFGSVYNVHDVNLDGRVFWKASPSDQAIVTGNVTGHPGNPLGLASYIIREQLP